MPITERVMALGDWSLRLSENTPPSILEAISGPFGQLVVTPTRIHEGLANADDSLMLAAALYVGVVLRPGPQRELGGCSQAWYLGDDAGGAGFLPSGLAYTAGTTLSLAVGSALSGSAFTSGTVGAGSLTYAWAPAPLTRRDALNALARTFDYEWRINPDRTVDLANVASLYGSTPTGVITRMDNGREAGQYQGITGAVGSTWDWESYGSKAIVWSLVGSGSAGGASPYRDPGGTAMTITRGFEQSDAPLGSEATIASWWLSQINREVRTVTVSSTDYAITGAVPCGGQVYLYDREQGLYDGANQVQFSGSLIFPVSARVVAVAWPVERGMGVYYRYHDSTNANYIDLSDWVLWESPGVQFEVSTGAQLLAPPSQAPPLSAFWSAWQTYAAEWRATSSNPAIGNGSINVSFRRLGTKLEINGKITAGSTTTYGSGEMRVTLPPGCVSRSDLGQQLGNLLLIPSGGGAAVPASIWVDAAATEMRFVYWPTSTTTGPVTATAPFTWANTSVATFDVALEIQP